MVLSKKARCISVEESGVPRNKSVELQSSNLSQRCQKTYVEVKTASSANGAKKTGYPQVED
jgi:hypothetical protein